MTAGGYCELAAELGQDDLEEKCRQCLEEEEEYLKRSRGWLLSMTLDQAAAGRQMDE